MVERSFTIDAPYIETRILDVSTQRKILEGIVDDKSARLFLFNNFSIIRDMFYVTNLVESAKQKPHRDANSSYWKLACTMAMETARFGFTDPSGQSERFDEIASSGTTVLDKYHPLYFLSTLAYMADTNQQATPHKESVIDYWNQKEGTNLARDEKIWSTFIPPKAGKVKYGHPEDFFQSTDNYLSRDQERLPAFIPHIKFDEQILRTGFTRDRIETMNKKEHAIELSNTFDPILSPLGIDISSVLQNPNEKWIPHT